MATAGESGADLGQQFRQAMAEFPAGVTIATTSDADGRWWGFTASAFCSLSLDPALVVLCIARSAECFPAFMESRRFAVHIATRDHVDLARRFATRGADKFAGDAFVLSERGLPILREGATVLECSLDAAHDGGDHVILVGRVEATSVSGQPPVVYVDRQFHSLTPLPASP